eukprot:scaffold7172_cov113-Isochrysis_galbana.AAC.4
MIGTPSFSDASVCPIRSVCAIRTHPMQRAAVVVRDALLRKSPRGGRQVAFALIDDRRLCVVSARGCRRDVVLPSVRRIEHRRGALRNLPRKCTRSYIPIGRRASAR